MALMKGDIECSCEEWIPTRSQFRESFATSHDFEKIDSPRASIDSGRIKSVLLPQGSLEDPVSVYRWRREETMLEKLKNIGTNLKYNIGYYRQGLWKPEELNHEKTFLLGQEYNTEIEKDVKQLEEDFAKIIWFTYRKNFPKLNHQEVRDDESYVSDTGWGCMIRSCQMAFAECLRRVLNDKFVLKEGLDEKIVSWFLDGELDPKKAPYSIQTLCKYMDEKFNLKPGNWLKPSAVLLTLEHIQEKYSSFTEPDLHIEIFLEGTIYINQALAKVTREKLPEDDCKTSLENEFEIVEEDENSLERKIPEELIGASIRAQQMMESSDPFYNDSFIECASPESVKEMEKLLSKKWNSSLMIVFLAKIGLDKPNPVYLPFIKELLSYPESVGMIGGKPGYAYYIMGHVHDKFIYLDPHFVQESVNSRKVLKENLSSYHCQAARYVSYSEIDTSIALAFMIKDENHFKKFIKNFKESCKNNDSFLGVDISPPREDLSDFESVGEDEFETISHK
jgi:cysteine protease ATG4